ncbi:MAG: hypothetical protein ABSG56_03760 [Bryobacteraceae bacterium]|jgi:Arc/MetJ-type ribon-helix-helix transcriptional regulator
MELHLTPDQEAFIRQGIEAGRFHGREDAVQEAMSLWEERGGGGWKSLRRSNRQKRP